jgi:hypothetical protein
MRIFLLTGSPLNPSTPASTCRYDSSLGDECKVHICVFLFKKCSFWDFSHSVTYIHPSEQDF